MVQFYWLFITCYLVVTIIILCLLFFFKKRKNIFSAWWFTSVSCYTADTYQTAMDQNSHYGASFFQIEVSLGGLNLEARFLDITVLHWFQNSSPPTDIILSKNLVPGSSVRESCHPDKVLDISSYERVAEWGRSLPGVKQTFWIPLLWFSSKSLWC